MVRGKLQLFESLATTITPIISNSTANADELHRNDALFSLLVVSSVILATTISSFLSAKKLNRYLPESGAAILFGSIIGGIILATKKTVLMKDTFFQPEMFYFFLLPPIIFEAGFSMKKKDFFANMGSVLLFAILGTFISALVFGYGIFLFAHIGWLEKSIDSNHAVESLLFGALISATDPIATLSVMSNLNVKPLLFSLVFGESVLNDAVSIVFYRTLTGYVDSSVFNGVHLLQGIWGFFQVFVGSLALGVSFGLASAFFMKRTIFMKEMPAFQVGILIGFAYLSYVAAELLGMTGVVSLFISGVVMKHYNWYTMSEEAQVTSHNVTRLLALLSETAIFVSLGINLVTSMRISRAWDPKLLMISTILLFVSRACNIFPMAFIANLRRKNKIPVKMQVMLWFAGMRGAIAFALSINLTTVHAINVQTTTLFLVVFSTLIQGCLTSPLLRKLNLVEVPKAELDYSEATVLREMKDDYNEFGDERESFIDGRSKKKNTAPLHRVWIKLDESVMKPLFGGRKRGTEESVRETKLKGGLVFEQLDEHDEALLELEDDHDSSM